VRLERPALDISSWIGWEGKETEYKVCIAREANQKAKIPMEQVVLPLLLSGSYFSSDPMQESK
jgi:hypothetical protein